MGRTGAMCLSYSPIVNKNHFDLQNASASTNATSELIAVFRKLVNKIHGSSLLTENF